MNDFFFCSCTPSPPSLLFLDFFLFVPPPPIVLEYYGRHGQSMAMFSALWMLDPGDDESLK
jgi:hypothetical protein